MSIGELSPKYDIKRLKLSNPNKILLGHLNINSVRSKFECVRDIINNNIDIDSSLIRNWMTLFL